MISEENSDSSRWKYIFFLSRARNKHTQSSYTYSTYAIFNVCENLRLTVHALCSSLLLLVFLAIRCAEICDRVMSCLAIVLACYRIIDNFSRSTFESPIELNLKCSRKGAKRRHILFINFQIVLSTKVISAWLFAIDN